MSLQLRIKRKNIAIKIYYVLMALLMIARYLLNINVPSVAFLLVAVIPVFFGSTNELLACVMSYIPLSIAFQYKYALLIAMVVMLLKNRWRMRNGYAFLLVLLMMIWELLHIGYGHFSIVEYLRGFAELLFMGTLIMVNTGPLDHKLIIRTLSVSVVGTCAIMFVMQLQQYNFDLFAVLSRSAVAWRFGQSNMDSGEFALNFNANNLGFICNLSTSGMLLLRKRKENAVIDLVLMICSLIFALMTLSRAAIICMMMIIALYAFDEKKKGVKGGVGILGVFVIVVLVGSLIYTYVPAIFDNLLERFQRKDIWNGRGSLLTQYMEFIFLSPVNLLFGIGVQGIYEKVSAVLWVHDVPHNGLQEVWLAWGVPGLIAMISWIGIIIKQSKVYPGHKRDLYQFAPLMLTLMFTMSGQLLTSSRALIALSFTYVCLCITSSENKKDEKGLCESASKVRLTDL